MLSEIVRKLIGGRAFCAEQTELVLDVTFYGEKKLAGNLSERKRRTGDEDETGDAQRSVNTSGRSGRDVAYTPNFHTTEKNL